MILQLAVMGKLVPQDPADEPASVLLQRIAAEKDRLIREGTIKRPKPLPAIRDDEKPFELPHGWEWENLGNLISVMDSGWSPACLDFPSRTKETWGVLKTTSVQNMTFHEIENKELPERLEPRSQYEVKAGDILITRAGPKNRVGISCLVETVRPKLMISDKIIRFHLITSSLYEPYIVLCLNSGATADYLEKAKSGMAESQVNISQDKLRLSPVPLCSFEEQKRIVAKVDSLMALCDKLETLQQQRQQLDPMTQTAVLDALTQEKPLPSPPLIREGSKKEDEPSCSSPDKGRLGGVSLAWQRLNQHMTTLFHTPESVKALRETILQLAVMGKLVPQDPNDEPAAVLLQHIATEKDRLIQEGKIKRQKSLSAIENSETLPELPKGWEVVNFGTYAQEVSTGPFGSMIHKSDYIQNGAPLINPSHMIDEKIVPDLSISVSFEKAEELASYKIYKDDIVISRRGEMGRCALVDDKSNGWLCGTGSFFIRFASLVDRQFILLLFKSKTIRDYLGGNSVGTTMTNLNHGILNNMPVLIPPLAEQKRIVAKVDSLMALCDKLEARLRAARATAGLFAAEAVTQIA
jgi:type I restriction enzyme S subunit